MIVSGYFGLFILLVNLFYSAWHSVLYLFSIAMNLRLGKIVSYLLNADLFRLFKINDVYLWINSNIISFLLVLWISIKCSFIYFSWMLIMIELSLSYQCFMLIIMCVVTYSCFPIVHITLIAIHFLNRLHFFTFSVTDDSWVVLWWALSLRDKRLVHLTFSHQDYLVYVNKLFWTFQRFITLLFEEQLPRGTLVFSLAELVVHGLDKNIAQNVVYLILQLFLS